MVLFSSVLVIDVLNNAFIANKFITTRHYFLIIIKLL